MGLLKGVRRMALLKEGDVIEIKRGMTVYADLPERLIYSNRKRSKKYVNIAVKVDNYEYLAGRYIVYKTVEDGGGESLEPSGMTYIPDEYHVFCFKVGDEKLKIDFYQTGFYEGLITSNRIKPVGKAKCTWEIIE